MNAELVRYLSAAISELGVEVRLGVTADEDVLRDLAPDVVVVATGARRTRPDVPGVFQPHVLSGDDLPRPAHRRRPGGGEAAGLAPADRRRHRAAPRPHRRHGHGAAPVAALDAARPRRGRGGRWPGRRRAGRVPGRAGPTGDGARGGREARHGDGAPPPGPGLCTRPAGTTCASSPGRSSWRSGRATWSTATGIGERVAPADQVILASGVEPDTDLADALEAAGFTVRGRRRRRPRRLHRGRRAQRLPGGPRDLRRRRRGALVRVRRRPRSGPGGPRSGGWWSRRRERVACTPSFRFGSGAAELRGPTVTVARPGPPSGPHSRKSANGASSPPHVLVPDRVHRTGPIPPRRRGHLRRPRRARRAVHGAVQERHHPAVPHPDRHAARLPGRP